MKKVVNQLRYVDTCNSYVTEEFKTFYKGFKRSLTTQLKKLNATEISIESGHFFISGFFKVKDQYYYFSFHCDGGSLNSDPQMLVRTAKHTKDFTGGSNNYVTLNNKTYLAIAKIFRIELPEETKNPRLKKTKQIDGIVNKTIQEGFCNRYVGSNKEANAIAWRLHEVLEKDTQATMPITQSKVGNRIICSKAVTEKFSYYYDSANKRISLLITN